MKPIPVDAKADKAALFIHVCDNGRGHVFRFIGIIVGLDYGHLTVTHGDAKCIHYSSDVDSWITVKERVGIDFGDCRDHARRSWRHLNLLVAEQVGESFDGTEVQLLFSERDVIVVLGCLTFN